MKTSIQLYIKLFLIMVSVISCKKDNMTDSEVYDATLESGYEFYKNSPDLLDPAPESPHGIFRVRFNSVALEALGADGKLPANATFGEGSTIVKEIYNSKGGEISLLAVMRKNSKSKDSAEDWLWGEYKSDGSTVYSVSKKGGGCVSCHSSGNHRDLVRLFDLH